MQLDAADGVHRIEDAFTNWYLIEDGDRLTVVDAGVPSSWTSLLDALARIGRTTDDVAAVVLTHAHFDHLGFAERARVELGIPVYVHEDDVPLTKLPRRYAFERRRLPYFLSRVKALPIAATLLRHRAWWPPPLGEVVRYSDAAGALPVPGAPRVVPTPGHTIGHCALHLPERNAVIAGDAIVTLDPYTARRGPRLVARCATADSERNLATLDAIAATQASYVLVGHGDPWAEGAESAVARAREAGSA